MHFNFDRPRQHCIKEGQSSLAKVTDIYSCRYLHVMSCHIMADILGWFEPNSAIRSGQTFAMFPLE